MKSIRVTVIGAVAAAAVVGVVAPATAQAAPRTVAAVQTNHHRHCDGDRDRDHWGRCCDRDHDHGGWWRHHHHGVEAGGGGMAASVAARTSHIGG
ncbi:hypothetical protein [Streptacidiphilus neutrinimicus]|uniref:hypothetical protein n=1 Tax=Streptacidiphilus neutrinimicus TaxID=105420 RepID=UPI0005A600FD|nr:hypothetical protein [Streptacidiphilus neutrinimicus]